MADADCDLTQLLDLSRGDLLFRLAEVRSDQTTLHKEMAFLKSQEAHTRSRVHQQSPLASIAQRDRDADQAALPHRVNLYDAEAKLLGLQLEDALIVTLLS